MKIPPFELERFFAKHEFEVPHLMCASDCESISLKELLDYEPDSRTSFEKQWLGYAQSLSSSETRTLIASLYKTIKEDQIFTHVGAQEAIFNFMNISLSKGDHIIVHWPCYQSSYQVAESIGCEVTKWHGDPNNNWELDLDFLKENLRSNTKVVVVNLPHNPTGYLMGESKFRELVSIVDSHGTILFSDEVYRGLEYDSSLTLPSACDLSDTAVSLGVLSKSFGLAGLRFGWIATKNRKVLSDMVAFKDYTTICGSVPSEFLAQIAFRNKEKIIQRNASIIQKNLGLLDVFFANHKEQIEWVRPKAGCIAFPRLLKTQDSDRFCNDLLEETGVLLAPGSKFSMGGPHLRIGYGRRGLEKGLELLSHYLRKKTHSDKKSTRNSEIFWQTLTAFSEYSLCVCSYA